MDSSSDSENEIINLGLMAKDYESGEEKIWVPKSKYDYMNERLLEAKLVH